MQRMQRMHCEKQAIKYYDVCPQTENLEEMYNLWKSKCVGAVCFTTSDK